MNQYNFSETRFRLLLIKLVIAGLTTLFGIGNFLPANATNHPFIEATFTDQNPQTSNKTIYIRSTTETIPTIQAELKYTTTSSYTPSAEIFIDKVHTESVRLNGSILNSTYGNWHLSVPTSDRCYDGANHNCVGISFHPNSEAIKSMPLGQQLQIILYLYQGQVRGVTTITLFA